MGSKILVIMKRISSKQTFFLKKIIPVILCINVIIMVFWILFFTVDFRELTFLLFPTIIFGSAWLVSFRKMKIVYLGNKLLKVDEEIILYEKIISINKFFFTNLIKITYQKDKLIKQLVFRPNTITYITPDYFKEIKKFIIQRQYKIPR
jgi:hypothetical protein